MKLTEPQRKALSFLVSVDHAGTRVMAVQLYGYRRNAMSAALRVLYALQAKGLVEYTTMGMHRTRRWVPTDAGRKEIPNDNA